MQLPIPSLKETLEQYTQIIKPLLSEQQYKSSLKKIDKFEQIAGKHLQNLLIEQQALYEETSWLHKAWIDTYLDGREVLSIGTNFCAEVKMDSFSFQTHEEFLSTFIMAFSNVCQSYIQGEWGVIYDARNQPLCSSQFDILRGASRIPCAKRDHYYIASHTLGYITIFYRNQLFKVSVFNPEGHLSNPIHSLKSILNTQRQQDISLSSICFADSDKAARLREKYLDRNIFFSLLENSLINISIIDQSFSNTEDKLFFYQYLNMQNTWLYKPLNFIYNLHDKSLHIHCEHTYQDAGTIVEIIKRVKANMRTIMQQPPIPSLYASFLPVKEYFDETYMKEVKLIQSEYQQKISAFAFMDIRTDMNESHLSGSLKNISKDAIMQFLLQYAQYKTFGEVKSMYEAVDMRNYQYGRTECLRSISLESLDFIHSLDLFDTSALLLKLKNAEMEHRNRIKQCKKAQGIDRHLYGLHLMINKLSKDKDQAKAFFSDIAYQKLNHNFLSTTSIGYNEHLDALLFSPAVHEGIGVNYNSEPEGMRFVISYYRSKEDQIQRFAKAIKQGAERIKQLR